MKAFIVLLATAVTTMAVAAAVPIGWNLFAVTWLVVLADLAVVFLVHAVWPSS